MALIVDPANLNQATEVTIDTAARTIRLHEAGNLSADGVTGQAVYSFLKEEWKSDPLLIPYPFPMVGITPEQFEFVESWKPFDDATRKLIRTAGWKEIDNTGTKNREYAGITTLGNIDATSKTVGDKAYYSFSSNPGQNFFTYAGPVDEAIQFYGDAANGNFDYTNDTLTLFIRIEGKLYGSCFSTESTIQAKVIKLSGPLAEANDAKITHSDAFIAGNAPYNLMGIEFFAVAQTKLGFSTGSHDFGIVVSGAAASVEEIYEFLQWSLRQNSDIDDGTGNHLGVLTDSFAQFVGDRLDTLAVTNSEGGGTGVFLDNVATDDTNSMRMIDNTGTYREYPFVASGSIVFNPNLQADANAIYRMYFLYTHFTNVPDLTIGTPTGVQADLASAGSNLPTLSNGDYIYVSGDSNAENNGLWVVNDVSPATNLVTCDKFDGVNPVAQAVPFAAVVGENPYGTPSAVLVDDNGGTDISGNVTGAGSVGFDFDYDGNIQGGRPAGTQDAEVIVVAIGHDTAQYVAATGTIARTTGNNVSLVAALERNYSNPT